MVGYRLVTRAGASLWVGLPRCLLGASRGGPWLAGFWGFCSVLPPWGHHCVFVGRSGGCGGSWARGLCRCRPCGLRRHDVCRPRRFPIAVCCCGRWGAVLGLAFPERMRAMRGPDGFGGGGACVWACTVTLAFLGRGVPGVSALCSLRSFSLCLCPAPLFLLVHFVSFFLRGGMRVVGVRRLWCWAWVRVLVDAGFGVGAGAVGDGGWVAVALWVDGCVSTLRHLVAFGFPGAGPGGAGGGWSAAVVVSCSCGWSWLPGSVWVAWPDAGVCVAQDSSSPSCYNPAEGPSSFPGCVLCAGFHSDTRTTAPTARG